MEADVAGARWRTAFGRLPTKHRVPPPAVPSHRVAGEDRGWPERLTGDLDELRLTVDGIDGLTRALLLAAGRVRAASLTLVVRGWSPLPGGWSAPATPLRGLCLAEYVVDEAQASLTVRYRLAGPCDLGRLLLAALRAVQPHRPDPGPTTADLALRCPTVVAAAPFLSRVADLVLPGDEGNAAVRRTDLLLVADPTAAEGVEALDVITVDDSGAHRAARTDHVVLDPAVHNPIGRTGLGVGALVTLQLGAAGARLAEAPGGDGAPRSWDVSLVEGLDRGAVAALQEVGRCDASTAQGGPLLERLLAQLCSCGIVVHARAAGPSVVDERLRRSWAEPLPDAADLFASTVAAVTQRRLAMRLHGSDAVVRSAAGFLAPAVSVLLVTMRPERLEHAIRQVASSTYPNLQLVIGLHGDTTQADRVARRARTLLGDRDVVVVGISRSVPFGAALGQVSARADGTLLTKVDDDDYYGPEHVWDLVLARDYSGAAIVGKPPEYVYLEPLDVTVRRPGFGSERYGSFVAGGTMLISRGDLDGVGGWRPVPRSVDRGLLDRILAAGGQVYATHGLGYLYVRHGDGHTWNPGTGHFLRGTGQQWHGLLRHAEFGTSEADAGSPRWDR